MKRINLQRIIYLCFAFSMIAVSLYFLEEPERDSGEIIAREMISTKIEENDKTGKLINPEFFYLPKNPVPGDFMVIGAGPFTDADNYTVKYDFEGTCSDKHVFAGHLYIIVAVGFDNEPGNYSITFKPTSTRDSEESYKLDIEIFYRDYPHSSFSMPASRIEGWTSEQLAIDREKVYNARNNSEQYPLWLQPFIEPLEGRVSSAFGAVRVINNNPPRRHNGIDIAAPEGTPIQAPNDGIVRLAEFLLSGGNTIIIDHGLGITSTYMHLEDIYVNESERVQRGDTIGTVGMTGYATGPHLHWEVNIYQRPVNPEQLMDNDLLLLPPAYVINLFEKSNRL